MVIDETVAYILQVRYGTKWHDTPADCGSSLTQAWAALARYRSDASTRPSRLVKRTTVDELLPAPPAPDAETTLR